MRPSEPTSPFLPRGRAGRITRPPVGPHHSLGLWEAPPRRHPALSTSPSPAAPAARHGPIYSAGPCGPRAGAGTSRSGTARPTPVSDAAHWAEGRANSPLIGEKRRLSLRRRGRPRRALSAPQAPAAGSRSSGIPEVSLPEAGFRISCQPQQGRRARGERRAASAQPGRMRQPSF